MNLNYRQIYVKYFQNIRQIYLLHVFVIVGVFNESVCEIRMVVHITVFNLKRNTCTFVFRIPQQMSEMFKSTRVKCSKVQE